MALGKARPSGGLEVSSCWGMNVSGHEVVCVVEGVDARSAMRRHRGMGIGESRNGFSDVL